MPWEENASQSLRPEKVARTRFGKTALAAFQAAARCHPSPPGHRPSASALGSILPTRWVGREPNALGLSFGNGCSYSVTSRNSTLSDSRPWLRLEPSVFGKQSRCLLGVVHVRAAFAG